MKQFHLLILFAFLVIGQSCTDPKQNYTSVDWPKESVETKPGSRWWWMGSAVDEANLTKNLEAYSEAGIGTMEITPIYGVQGNDDNEVDFLSDRWMELYNHTQSEGKRLGMVIDMNTGTGWPFGGPEVGTEDAACKLVVQRYNVKGGEVFNQDITIDDEKQKSLATLVRVMAFSNAGEKENLTKMLVNDRLEWKAPDGNWELIALFEGRTQQQVKRAAPGGEGNVLNHFSKDAVARYLNKFAEAFERSGVPVPHNFFNDSYEVYGADWTPGLLEAFEEEYNYKLEDYLPEFLSEECNDTTMRVIADYRELLSDLLLKNFTNQWTEWAHESGSKTRNQAHGSPGNLIDIYAAVDVPECEGFGLSEFHINGLRHDSLTRHNDSDFSMLKYASSAAHISGKPYTSSETFTWLTEHFRTSLSQCKPDLDLMFVSGVNRVYFHGTTYSPAEAEWPGWKFYASVDMSPTNPLWRDAAPFFKYISRSQSFLQMGKPDNDFLVYLPVYDMWNDQDGRLLMFDIHKMKERAPEFIKVVSEISHAGYDVDYTSENFISSSKVENGEIVTTGGARYKALIVPGVNKIRTENLNRLMMMAEKGAQIIFMDHYPTDVPGFSVLEERREKLKNTLAALPETDFSETQVTQLGEGKIITGSDFKTTLVATGVKAEQFKVKEGLHCIRRSNKDGYHYFISALKSDDTDAWIPLAKSARSVVFFDPMTGKIGKAAVKTKDGETLVRIQLKSGQSVILKTFTDKDIDVDVWPYINEEGKPFVLKNNWQLSFTKSIPAIADTFQLPSLIPWTQLDMSEAKINMGTAAYFTSFSFNKSEFSDWILDLGDVRETARIIVNEKEVQTLWAVPYQTFVGEYLKDGLNTIKIEVTGLPANRIAQLDREGVKWRRFKEINLVDLNYKRTGYGGWQTMPAGLNSEVKLIPVK